MNKHQTNGRRAEFKTRQRHAVNPPFTVVSKRFFVTFAVIHLNESCCFTAYLLQSNPSAHASCFGRPRAGLELLPLTAREGTFLKTGECALIFTKLLGPYLFFVKSLRGLYKTANSIKLHHHQLLKFLFCTPVVFLSLFHSLEQILH